MNGWLAVSMGMLAAAIAACGGGRDLADADGADADVEPIGLAVTASRHAMVVAGMSARAGYRYLVLDVVVEARRIGPLPVAPNAFEVVLSDGTRRNAQTMATNSIENGCTSRSLPLGSSTECTLVFEVSQSGASPATLVWSDGTRTATAAVPPPN
jgi:hypothetical protein